MAEFLVEIYVSRTNVEGVRRYAESARVAALAVTREGEPVRLVRSIFVPEDETCLLLYEASSLAAVREAASRAGVPFDRVAEAVPESVGLRGRRR